MSNPYYPGWPTGQQMPPLPPGVQPTQQQPMYPGFQQQQGFPQQYQQQPQIPQQPQYPQGADLNQRLPNDNSVPQELRGRTMGEAIRYYGIMREDFVQRNAPTGQQQQQQQFQQPQQQFQQRQPGTGFQQPQRQQPSAQPRFGQPQQGEYDSVEATVRGVLQEVLPQALAPVVRPMQQQQLVGTYNGVKGRFSDWQQFEPDIIGSMQNSPPEVLQDPAAWEAAYYHAKGRAMTHRQLDPGPQQQQGQSPQQQPYVPPQVYQQPQYGYQGPAGNTFVEGPTPQAQFSAPQTDPRDEVFAKRYGMPLEVYRSWKGGKIGLMQTPPQQQQQQPAHGGQNAPLPYGMQQPQMPQQQFNGMTQQPQFPGYYQPQQFAGGQYAP